jgi:dihydrofolate reductase
MLTLIAARARDGAIGRDGDIPWQAPEDLRFFQSETMGGALIMGRRTWESLPVRPLPRRLNIVVSRSEAAADLVCADPVAAIGAAHEAGYRRVYGAGGARIYADLLPCADRLLITEVDIDVPDADAHFPDFDETEWRLIGETVLRGADPKCTVREYLRR